MGSYTQANVEGLDAVTHTYATVSDGAESQ